MHLLLFSDQYYPLGGGIEQYLRGLARQLVKTGVRVSVLTRSVDGTAARETTADGIAVYRTDLLVGAIADPESVLRRWRAIAGLIQPLKPDVIYANHHTSLAAIKAARCLGIPVVYGCHGWGLLCPLKIRLLRPDQSLCHNRRSVPRCGQCMVELCGSGGLKPRLGVIPRVLRYNRYQDMLLSADARIVHSRLAAGLFPPDTTDVIYLGLDSAEYAPASPGPFMARHGLTEYGYILVPSRIHEIKGQIWAVRALERLPADIRLVLAGNSSLFNAPADQQTAHTRAVKDEIERLGLQGRIVFTGFLEQEAMRQAYSGALATLVPSVWLEPFGYVTAESMACATPVVVTENCGSAELVRQGVDGFVVPCRRPQPLADAVLSIRDGRALMGTQARRRVQALLGWEGIAAQVMDVLRRVC